MYFRFNCLSINFHCTYIYIRLIKINPVGEDLSATFLPLIDYGIYKLCNILKLMHINIFTEIC